MSSPPDFATVPENHAKTACNSKNRVHGSSDLDHRNGMGVASLPISSPGSVPTYDAMQGDRYPKRIETGDQPEKPDDLSKCRSSVPLPVIQILGFESEPSNCPSRHGRVVMG